MTDNQEEFLDKLEGLCKEYAGTDWSWKADEMDSGIIFKYLWVGIPGEEDDDNTE